MPSKWQVWSVTTDMRALVVDEGAEAHCVEAAERRNQLAVKHGLAGTEFQALPEGEVPATIRSKPAQPPDLHEVRIHLTATLRVMVSVLDHHDGTVPAEAWEMFTRGYRLEHEVRLTSVAQYVTREAAWAWDPTVGDITIGDLAGPFAVNPRIAGPLGCAIWFYAGGTGHPTGLHVAQEDLQILAGLLRPGDVP